MNKNWIAIIIALLILILAFVLFVFPGYYLKLESRSVESNPKGEDVSNSENHL